MKQVIAELTGVTKEYKGSVTALNAVDLQLRGGEITSLLGPNGAGKTTAIKILLGLAAPTRGTVRVFGGDPRRSHNRVRTGAMMQVAKVPENLRVREHINIFRSYYPNPLDLNETLAITEIEPLAHRLFGTLSGGERQRVMLALALCGNPDLLFLDEPTVGLDVDARRALWNCIRTARAQGRAVLLTTHYLTEAEALADRVVVLNHGSIIADGTVSEVQRRVSLRRIRCVTSISADTIRSFGEVSSVRVDGHRVEIMTPTAERVARQLLERDAALSDLEITGAGLEEAFLELTRGAQEVA